MTRAASEPTAEDRLDRTVWSIIAAVAFIVCAAAVTSRFSIAWATVLAPAGACSALWAGTWFYARRRKDARLASALNGTAQVVAFTAVGAPLSYLAASAGLPLQDHLFDAADHALGFDWLGLLHWMNAHPVWHSVFSFAYLSFTIQATTAVLALAFTGRLIQLRVFMLAFMVTALVTIAISAVLPAQGVWGHYGLTRVDYPDIIPVTQETHLPIFNGLRDGTFRALVGTGSEGIITFPSLHAALGLIFALALWPIPTLRWIALALNVLMIVATPIDGGHYFSDVVAGLAIALACWLVAQKIAERATGARRTGQISYAAAEKLR